MRNTPSSAHRPADERSPLDKLPDRLSDGARNPGERAAIAVLVTHGRWLRHPSFLLTCVRSFRDEWWIDWRIVRRFLSRTPCPELSHEVLLLAAELAQWDTGRRLHESSALAQLDAVTHRRLMEAIGPDLIEQRPTHRRR